MKTAVLAAAIALGSVMLHAGRAHAEDRVGYVDVRRVLTESDAGRQATAALQAWYGPKIAEAEKAPAAKQAEAIKRVNDELRDRDAAAFGPIRARVEAISEKLRVERKLSVVVDGAPLAAAYKLTAEVVKRLNAEPAPVPVAAAEDLARAQAENAALRAELEAAKTKPTAPAPAPSPPVAATKPPAPKTGKP